MKRKKSIKFILSIISIMAILSGCKSDTESTTTQSNGDTPKKIIIGTGNAYKPYCYLDENNKIVGFEIDVLKKIDEKLPQYEFEYKTFDFDAILVSLETGKIDLAAHQFETNEERKKKFTFGDVSLTDYDLRIVVKEDRNDIQSLEDLANINGAIEIGTASTNKTAVVSKWNEENGNKLELVLAPSDTAVTLQNLETGKIDAFVNIQRNVDEYKSTYGVKIKTVGEPISTSNSYYLYKKDDATGEQLKKDVDEVLKALKEDGTLAKLSNKWLGGDYIAKD